MTYSSLLVAVEEGLESEARLELACDLAVSFDALLIGMAASAPQPPMVDQYSGGAMLGELLTLYRDMAQADVDRARVRFESVVGARGVRSEWRGKVGYPSGLFIQAARAADLVILGAKAPGSPYHAPDPADVLMGAGRPVLVVPGTPARSPVQGPAVVAWTESREARHAVAASIPLLQKAAEVVALEICPADALEDSQAEVADVAGFLARHEVKAKPQALISDGTPTAAQILSVATNRKAGLIVAGGYGHARLREWAMGGVTKALMSDSDICILLAH